MIAFETNLDWLTDTAQRGRMGDYQIAAWPSDSRPELAHHLDMVTTHRDEVAWLEVTGLKVGTGSFTVVVGGTPHTWLRETNRHFVLREVQP